MKQLPNLDEKNKEKPLCYGYSVKARALLHAQFARLPLPPDTLALGNPFLNDYNDVLVIIPLIFLNSLPNNRILAVSEMKDLQTSNEMSLNRCKWSFIQ